MADCCRCVPNEKVTPRWLLLPRRPRASPTGAPARPFAGPRSRRTRRSARAASSRGSESSTRRCRSSATTGFHRGSIDQIAKRSGCSRVSFYQYFASKEDLFRHLAVQVARQVSASTEALDPLTPDLDGWAAMRAWVARYDEIHARYEAIFVRLRERRGPGRGRRDDGRRGHHADPLPVGDHDASFPAARSRHPAAPGVPEPHARRRRRAPVGGTGCLPARPGR